MLVEEHVPVADLGLLVAGERDVLERRGLEAEVHVGQVEGVLVEHPGQRSQLRRLGPVAVGVEPVDRAPAVGARPAGTATGTCTP